MASLQFYYDFIKQYLTPTILYELMQYFSFLTEYF